ncbi:MAG: 50S ribosomal protein L20 [Desulfohalobiaceae bacterium]|nr:50S ribosomal protein L20 [Desulfohalobiaceae bacterium]
MRIKRGTQKNRRHKKYLNDAKGYRGSRSTLYRPAREAVEKAHVNAYRDRRRKKREFRKLWITRINAGARQNGLSYSEFMTGLRRMDVQLNRKVLADMAVRDSQGFAKLAEMAKTKV